MLCSECPLDSHIHMVITTVKKNATRSEDNKSLGYIKCKGKDALQKWANCRRTLLMFKKQIRKRRRHGKKLNQENVEQIEC